MNAATDQLFRVCFVSLPLRNTPIRVVGSKMVEILMGSSEVAFFNVREPAKFLIRKWLVCHTSEPFPQ